MATARVHSAKKFHIFQLYAHCTTYGSERIHSKSLNRIKLCYGIQFLLCNCAIILSVSSAVAQTHIPQLFNHLITCQCALLILYNDKLRASSISLGIQKKQQQHCCNLERKSFLTINGAQQEYILHSSVQFRLFTSKYTLDLVPELLSIPDKVLRFHVVAQKRILLTHDKSASLHR